MNIIASYKCNFNCPFCFIKNNKDNTLLDLDWLEDFLSKLDDIEYLEILGGEPLILPDDYLNKLIDICYKKLNKPPKMYTNCSIYNPTINRVDSIVSYDYGLRQDLKKVMYNMVFIDMPFKISSILTNKLVEENPREIYKYAINNIPNLYGIDLVVYKYNHGLENFTPTKDKLMSFIRETIKYNIEIYNKGINKEFRISFYDAFDNPKDEIRTFYDCVEILPDKKIEVSLRDYKKPKTFNNIEDARKYYNSMKDTYPLEKCYNCKYRFHCINQYSDEKECRDYDIMKELEELHEYYSKLQVQS